MKIKLFIIILTRILLSSDQIPSASQDNPILIQNGTVYTISNGIQNSTFLDRPTKSLIIYFWGAEMKLFPGIFFVGAEHRVVESCCR